LSKLQPEPRLPAVPQDATEYQRRLNVSLTDLFRALSDQVNGVSESTITSRYNALTAAPVGVIMKTGDFVPNISPSEQGSAGFKYILAGWQAVVDGTASPVSVLEARTLTGN
jgi:hypothetical protein